MSFVSTTKRIQLQDDVHLHVEQSFPQVQSQDYPTIVFLHFWGGSSRTWSPVNHLIAHTFPTARIDFRGWGSSTGPADETEYSILRLAQDVENVITRLNLQKYIIVGHSMGAKVAQAIAGRNLVNGLAGLVLLCPAPPTPLMLPKEMRDQQISAYDNEQNAEFVVRNVLTAKSLPDGIIERIVEDMIKGSPSATAAWPRYAMNENILELAKKISVPTVIIAGGKDQVEPVTRIKAEVSGNIPFVKFLVLEEVGHLALLEAPEKVAEIINETAQYAAYEEATQRPHEVEWTNQIIGDAAAYAASRVMSGTARIWGFVSAWVYREIETRGLDFIDAEAAKEIGRKAAQTALAEKNSWELEN
ncbi:hypothetical protein FOXYS1_4009 [Fusarium oxysporum]|uniref:AB hydrolase-1 domain-containing protein n=1 Tax=Fusarium oxysporum TaxID=5507 RepID=A0A8H5AIG3_FUSOX|nr:hypothetical protein FOXYS1_4009 [Fusarium oxysporum]